MGLSGSQKAYKQYRAGIMRFGASRFGYYNYNVVVLIGGVNVTNYVVFDNPAPVIEKVLNAQPNTATFTLKPGATLYNGGELVTISVGDATNIWFAGQIQKPTYRLEPSVDSNSYGYQTYQDIHAIDWRRLFDRRLVNAEYVNQSADAIAVDIINNNTSGFSTYSIPTGLPVIANFVVSDESPSAALTRLFNLIDRGWYVDGYKIVHAPSHITGDSSSRAGTNPVQLARNLWSFVNTPTISFDGDVSQIRSRAILNGQSTSVPIAIPGNTPGTTINLSSANFSVLGHGGGGAGGNNGGVGGGGGAGGKFEQVLALGVGSYLVVVGAGGVAANGSPTTFSGLTALGGGKGADGSGISPTDGNDGGCGGGGSGGSTPLGASSGGSGSQGGNGGEGEDDGSGGGGGTGGSGTNSASPGGGAGSGGPGTVSNIDGTNTPRGGGGGGNGTGASGSGGTGGGGNGGAGGNPGTPGVDGTGGGGGGGGYNGGSGTFIVAYDPTYVTASGGTITTRADGYKVHTMLANDTFVVSAIQQTVPAQVVTSIPVQDASQVNNAAGTLKVGNQVVSYLSVTRALQPATGTSPTGSPLASDLAAGATSATVVDGAQFNSSGWAKVGEVYFSYTGKAGNTLTGIPATGFGSVTAAAKANTQVTGIDSITLSVSGTQFAPAIAVGAPVTQRVIVDNTTLQAAIAAVEGGDGVHEYLVPEAFVDLSGAIARGNAELTNFGTTTWSMTWDTLDMNAEPGRIVSLATIPNTPTGIASAGLVITHMSATLNSPNGLPRRTVTASSVLAAAVLDVMAFVPNQ